MTLPEVEAALTMLADAPGMFVNGRLTLAGNVTIDGEEVVVVDLRGRTIRWAPEDINMLGRASASDVRLAELCGGNQ